MASKSATRKSRSALLLPAMCGLLLFNGFETGGFQLVLRHISGAFSMTALGSGLLVTAQYLGVVIVPLLFGRLADLVGKKRVLVLSVWVFCMGCVLAATAKGVPVFIVGAFLVGAGASACECAGSAALADMYPEKSARYISVSQGMLSIGAVISPVLTQYGMDKLSWSWQIVFLLPAGVYLLLSALLLTVPFGAAPAAVPAAMPKGKGGYFRSGVFRLLFYAVLLFVGLENGIGFFLESLFALELSSASLGAAAISVYWGAMALSQFFTKLTPAGAKRTLLIGFSVSAALFFGLAASRGAVLSLVVCALVGFAFGPIWSVLMDLSAKEFPERTGGAIGLMSAGCGLGGAVFPVLMGLLSEGVSLRAAFVLLGLSALLAGLFCLLVFVRKRKAARSA